ncbi:MAG: MauE/DoxX family redox-associated membrane protein [Steroidobacteraceae bacterium]
MQYGFQPVLPADALIALRVLLALVIDCGCFQGALRQRLRWALVARNLALTVLCAALLAPPAAAPGASAAWIIFNGVMGGLVLALTLQSLNALWSIDLAWRRPRPASNDTAGGMA